MLKSKAISLWLLLVGTVAAWSAETPFSRGVNLTNWLQASSAQNVHFAKFGRADFVQIQQLGLRCGAPADQSTRHDQWAAGLPH